jgi:hypothetical protein
MQQTLFAIEPKARHPRRVVKTAYFDEKDLINDLMWLHNSAQPFDVDPTYSTGRFWQGLPEPVYKFDLSPQLPEVNQSDCRNLPFESGQVGSIMFDPPFITEGTSKSKIKQRFTAFQSLDELKQMYSESLKEFYRILRPNGLLVFKCQDITYYHKQFLTHVWLINVATQIGFYSKDLFILIRDNVLLGAHIKKQQHARKTHSYFVVLKKAPPNKHFAADASTAY